MNEETPDSPSHGDPWIAMGEDAANEDMLIGNRSGLLHLREAIDGAIEKGEYFLPGETGLSGVRLLASKPAEWQSASPWLDKAYASGCVVIALLCGGIFLFGCVQLIQWLF